MTATTATSPTPTPTSAPTDEPVRITVDTPERRLDLAAPAGVPLAELIRTLVRTGGEALAQRGAATGWVVRRADGSPLSGAKTLPEHGVQDGDVVHLVSADTTWPPIEFDDISDAIAASRPDGTHWTADATRRTGVVLGFAGLLAALVVIVRDGSPATASPIAGGLALVLLGAGAIAARTGRDPDDPLRGGRRAAIGTVLAAAAMPYAFTAGYLGRGGPRLLLAAVIAVILAGLIAAVAVGALAPPFVAAIGAGTAGLVGVAAERFTSPAGAAAIVIGALTLGAGLVPSAAVRVGGLGRWHDDGDADVLASSVARGDLIVSGLGSGIAIAATAAAWILAEVATSWSRLLVLACAIALGLRARGYGSVHRRLIALAAPVGTAIPLVLAMPWSGSAPIAVAGVLLIGGLTTIIVSAYPGRLRQLSRLAGLIEAVALLAVLPLLCGVLGLYARARNLA